MIKLFEWLLIPLNYVADDPKKTEHLLALDGAKERLVLFEADLSVEGSFDSAVNGCVCVFHTASPVLFSVDDPQVSFSFFCNNQNPECPFDK